MVCGEHIKKLNGQFFAAFPAAALENFLPVTRAHALAKSVPGCSSFFLGLICSFWHNFDDNPVN
jgi:hypothetical protein